MIKYILKSIGYTIGSAVLGFIVCILAVLYNGNDIYQHHVSMKLYGVVILSLTIYFLILRVLKKISPQQHMKKQVNTHLFFVLPFAVISYLAFYDKYDSLAYISAVFSGVSFITASIVFLLGTIKKKVVEVNYPEYHNNPPVQLQHNAVSNLNTQPAKKPTQNPTQPAQPHTNRPSWDSLDSFPLTSTPVYAPPTYPTYTAPPAAEKKMDWIYTDKGLVYAEKDGFGNYKDSFGKTYGWGDAYGTKKEKKWY